MTRRTLRIVLSAVAVAACLPYLALKVIWLSGGTVGLNDPALAHDPVMVAANAVTFGLDAVAVTLAVAFVTRWGRRLPAWLVAAPMWVGAGLLGAIALVLPIETVRLLVVPPAAAPVAPPLQPWVFPVVYGGFMLQGLSLLAGYWFYAHERWPSVLTGKLGDRRPGSLGVFGWVALALAAAAVVAGVGVAAGTAVATLTVALLIVPVVGALALLALRRERPVGWPRGLVTAVWYAASGAAASWGVYGALVAAIPNPLAGPAGVNTADLVAHVLLAASGFALVGAGLVGHESAGRVGREERALVE